MVIKTLVTIDWKFQLHRKWYRSLLQQLRVYINQTFSRLWRTHNPCTPFNCRHCFLTACPIFLWKLIAERVIFINTSLISESIILALNQWFKTHNKRMFYSLFIGFFLVTCIYASAMVTSTSTPGSILMDVWTTVKEISLINGRQLQPRVAQKIIYLTGGNSY